MATLYLTADRIGEVSGGGAVTHHESLALRDMETECYIKGREQLGNRDDPWGYDDEAYAQLGGYAQGFSTISGGVDALVPKTPWKLAHCYAGTFTHTVELLRKLGCKVTYTAAAHDPEISKREHEALGLSYNYPHLTDPVLWKRYVGGYVAADLVICPSKHSADCMRRFGCKNVTIIPHGCDIPATVAKTPLVWTLGYLGTCGAPDKGVRYLLEAWKKLNYKDAILLLGGRDSTSPWVLNMIRQFGGGNIQLTGWLNSVSDFYNRVTWYCQPSCSEGFGIEVLEAMAHHRPVICSNGAGAVDLVNESCRFDACNVEVLIEKIEAARSLEEGKAWVQYNYDIATKYTWPLIRQRYLMWWESLMNPSF